MSTVWGRRLQHAAACLLLVAYAGLSHYSNAVGVPRLGAALALMPLTATGVLAWRSTPPAVALLWSAALAGTAFLLWPLLVRHFSLLFLIQETGLYAVLGATFGRSLRRDRIALCTSLADRMHGPLSPREVAYTRKVTAAWACFFFAVASLCLLLYVTAPVRVWSVYANFCVLPLVAAMFAVEYGIRRRALPQAKPGIIAAVRAYLVSPPFRDYGH